MDPELQGSFKKLVNITIFVMVLIAVYFLFKWVFPILGMVLAKIPILLLPFILALLLAIVIEPVVMWFENVFHLRRNWSVLLSLILVLGGFILIINLIISIIINEMSALYKSMMGSSDQVMSQILGSLADLRLFFMQMNIPEQLQNGVQAALQKGMLSAQDIVSDAINGLLQVFTALPTVFIFLIIATVATYFMVKDRAEIRSAVLGILPRSAQTQTRNVFQELAHALTGFLKAYTILISITAIITLVSLRILGVKYVLMIAIVVGLADILPVLGPGTIFIPWIIWEFISGRTGMGVSLLIVYIIISAVRQFLEPKIVGDNIGLHPLLTLISLYVGLQLGGIIGMILGPITVVIIIACYRAGVFEGIDWRKKA